MIEDIIARIMEKTTLAKEEVERKVLEKQTELSGLVSREGAAYIVAKELGLDLFGKELEKVREIKDISAGIKNLNFSATVFKIFPAKEFEKEGKKIKVANFFLSDSSGNIRMSLWDEQTELLKNLKEGNIVEISGAYSKESRNGIEVRLGKRGKIKVIGEAESKKRVCVSELKEGKFYEVRAALLQLFESSPFYEVCPQCGSRAKDKKCAKHGTVEPKYAMVVSGVMDDGSGNIRVVFFREQAEKIIGLSTQEALQKKNLFENLQLGKEFVFVGRVRKNLLFERNEFVVQDFREVDAKQEIEILLNSFGKK